MDDTKLNIIVCKNIKNYRLLYNKNNKKMTQRKLSKLTNIPLSQINNIENNKQTISIQNLYKISIVLDIPISKFFEV